jgi:UDP-N-acetylglucosamine 4-epimerase
MAVVDKVYADLMKNPKTWLVTGAAGFIGVNLCKRLIELGQFVIGLDNSSNCGPDSLLGYASRHKHIDAFNGDIKNPNIENIIAKADIILHQAGWGNAPKSFTDPIGYSENNILGFLNVLNIAKKQGNKKVVWASSSSTKQVSSPYGLTKKTCEDFSVFYKNIIGLRYHNVYGPFQALRAAIPIFICKALKNEPIEIYGKCFRDFTYIDDVVRANIYAGVSENLDNPTPLVFDIGSGVPVRVINVASKIIKMTNSKSQIIEKDFRKGDIILSCAQTSLADAYLDFLPNYNIENGLKETVAWYKTYTI